MTEKQLTLLLVLGRAVAHVSQPEVLAAYDAALEEDRARKEIDNLSEVVE